MLALLAIGPMWGSANPSFIDMCGTSLLKLERGGFEAAQNLADRLQAAVVRWWHDRSRQCIAVPSLQWQRAEDASPTGETHRLFGHPDAGFGGVVLRLIYGESRRCIASCNCVCCFTQQQPTGTYADRHLSQRSLRERMV